MVGRPGLSPSLRRDARAVAEALFSTDQGVPEAGRIDWLMDELDHFVAQAGLRARFILRGCLTAISQVSPRLVGRQPPFRDLPLPERVAALERLEHSPLAMAFLGAKAMLCMIYYEHPQVQREHGADTECLLPVVKD